MLQNISENDALMVTIGSQKYSVDRDWGQLPRRGINDVISDVAVLEDNRIAVLLRGRPAIRCFDPSGEQVDSEFDYEIKDGHGMTADGDGLLIVDRDRHEVIKLNGAGKLEFRIGDPEKPRWRHPFNHPTAAIRGQDGRIYVTDGYGNGRIHVFSSQATYLYSFGEIGTDPGHFLNPHSITLHRDGRLVVADRDNNRIQLFDPDGSLSEIWEGFWRPMGIATLSDGTIIATDQSPALHAISSEGKRIGRARPSNDWPHGVAVSSDGCIFIAEMHPTSITRMKPSNEDRGDSE
jgi:hypothetical protein